MAQVENVCIDDKEELYSVQMDREVLLRWRQIKDAEQLASDLEVAHLLFKWYDTCHPSQWCVQCVCCQVSLLVSLVCGKPCHTHTATVTVSRTQPSTAVATVTGTEVKHKGQSSHSPANSGDVFSVRQANAESGNSGSKRGQKEEMLDQYGSNAHTDFSDEADGEFERGLEAEQQFSEQEATDRPGAGGITYIRNKDFRRRKDIGADCVSGEEKLLEEQHQCQQCGQTYPSLNALSLHAKTVHHAIGISQSVKCKRRTGEKGNAFQGGACKKSVSSESQVVSHGGMQSKKCHCCDICQKQFKSSVTLGVHRMKFHTAAKLCSDDLTLSLEAESSSTKTHTEQKPFTCLECGQAFKKASHLSSHQKLAHSHRVTVQGKRQKTVVRCEMCHKCFRLKKSLLLHSKFNCKTTCSEGQQEYGDGTQSDKMSATARDVMDSAQGMDTCTANISLHEEAHINPLTCSLSEKKLKSKNSLKGYKQKEHSKQQGPKKNKCAKCEAVFRFKSQLTKHMRSHSDERPFSCGQCGAKFKSLFSLSQHCSWHEDMRSTVCHLCGKSCLGLRSLTRHIKMQHGTEHMVDKPYKCTDCTASFSSMSKLTAHVGVHSHHKNYVCRQCGQAFRSQHILDVHMRRHTGERPFQCGECEESFIDKSRLKRHQLQHKSASQELCHICGAGFPSKAHLAIHIQRHTAERPFSCGQCGKAYKTTGDLKSHMMSHSEDRPFPCAHCPYAARTQAMLNKHARKHTGERPYQCEQCSAAFAYFSSLSAHRKLHSNSKPFVCPVCSAAFYTAYNLRLHSRKHSGEKPYCCPLCPESFSWHSGLKCHMRKHDGTETQERTQPL